ncbi:TolC family protein [Elizabethkingia sp. JS20170427COW]|uniref:TolC family protein n=1 Tax=Elizabethkingia sp. JS20170427COW TaxID=2583851 RepID=UPI001110DDA3|nr:TolC family protein [Elizabethkingia sp. JS20170427COW]QCX54083.1 TolC family protein [Elizabethkingia sp. JS20170427COW]
MEKLLLCSLYMVLYNTIQAQDHLKISSSEAETIFLQNNLSLISEKLKIEEQKAEVLQAKLWPNPQFTVGEINLWKNKTVESSPPFFGNFGRNQQVAFELNQLIQTAGKRKKLIAIEQVEVSKAEQYFEELLRVLKLELRSDIIELYHLQQNIALYQHLVEGISTLTKAYQKQFDKGYIAKAEVIRLKAQQLELNNEIANLTQQALEVQQKLRTLLRTDPSTQIEIQELSPFYDEDYLDIPLDQLEKKALDNRPDYQLALLDEEASQKQLSYERAQKIPDITLGINYDRNGSTMLNFVGVGFSIDLPLFNKNQGNIKKATIAIEKARIQKEQTQNTLTTEVHLAYQALQHAIDFYKKMDANLENDIDTLLKNYTKHFTIRNINLLEFIDFSTAYLNHKKLILDAQKNIRQKTEELNFYVGTDL